MPEWYEQTGTIYWYDQYALNESRTAFARYDPDRIVKELLFINADIYAIYAANQFNIAYYPSKVIPQHPGLRGHDYVGEIVPRLRAKGKRVVLYINWLDSKHPEWNLVSLNANDSLTDHRSKLPLVSWADPSRPEGKVRKVPGGKWQCPCVNSPKRALVKRIARELVENYEFDGLHLDMFMNLSVCVCPYCRPSLRKILGKARVRWQDIRAKWHDYLDWKYTCHSDFLAELNAILKSGGRNLVALHNGMAPLIAMPVYGISEQWLPHLDAYISECFEVFCQYADMNATSLSVKFHRAVRKPSWMLLTSTPVGMGHTPIPQASFLLHAAAAKANGCHVFGPCGVGARQDTTSDRRLLELSREALAFWRKDPDNFTQLEPTANVAVVCSFNTRSFHEPVEVPAKHQGEFNGWGRVLLENHVPFNLEMAELLDDTAAARYDTLILPNVACTDARFEEVIRRFVTKGGRVIATAETSLLDAQGRRKRDFGLSDVLGVSHRKPYESAVFYLENKQEPIIGGGQVECVKSRSQVLVRLVKADPDGSPSGGLDSLPVGVTPWPLHTTHRYGKGQAHYLAWAPGKYLMDIGYWQTSRWMWGVLRRAMSKPLFTTNAPSTVEIMTWRDPRRNALVFKLANRTIPQVVPMKNVKREVFEIIPVRDLEIVAKLRQQRQPRVACAETPVRVVVSDHKLRIRLEKIEAYASVRVQGLQRTRFASRLWP